MAQTQGRSTQYPHIEWVDLYDNGILEEVAVLNRDQNGNLNYIKISELDRIDRNRLVNIVKSRHANQMPLWETMSTITLNNGVNALTYFHQLVKQKTASGQHIKPSLTRRGDVQQVQRQAQERYAAEQQAEKKPATRRRRAPAKKEAQA